MSKNNIYRKNEGSNIILWVPFKIFFVLLKILQLLIKMALIKKALKNTFFRVKFTTSLSLYEVDSIIKLFNKKTRLEVSRCPWPTTHNIVSKPYYLSSQIRKKKLVWVSLSSALTCPLNILLKLRARYKFTNKMIEISMI